MNCNGVDHALFLADKKPEYTIFGAIVSESRWNEVNAKLMNLLNGWIPEPTNITQLYIKHGNDWKLTPIHTAENVDYYESWKSMPIDAIEYVRSLPEYNAEMFKKITGISDAITKIV